MGHLVVAVSGKSRVRGRETGYLDFVRVKIKEEEKEEAVKSEKRINEISGELRRAAPITPDPWI